MRRGRRTGVLAGALVAGVLVAAPSATADHPPAPLHTPAPAPGSLVPAGATTVSAYVRGGGVVDADWQVDGQPLGGGTVGPVETGWGQRVAASTVLTAGVHVVDLTVTTDGGTLTRSWTFASTDRSARRLSGSGRVETAVAISQERFADGAAGAVVLARADDFADALAGAPLAFHLDGPLLLTGSDDLHAAARQELQRVLPEGATVHLLGGEQSLAPTVAATVEDLGYRVSRHAGDDRYETAVAIAEQLPGAPSVVIASGETFPDALAASVPAARDGMAVLLTRRDALPDAVRVHLAALDPSLAFVVGGTSTISDDVIAQVDAEAGETERVWGHSRFETAVAVAERFFDGVSDVSIASGVSFPDALTGTGDAARRGQPLLLGGPVMPAATDEFVRAARPMRVVVYGGPDSVPEMVAQAAVRAAEDGAGAPELTQATPGGGAVAFLDRVTLQLDGPATTTVHLEIGEREVAGTVTVDGTTVTFVPSDHEPFRSMDVPHQARLVISAQDGDGRLGRHEVAFTYLVPDPLFATVGGVDLYLPSRDVEMVGFHQSNHDGARQLAPFDTATPMLTLPSRGRGTGSRTAADIVASPDQAITAPVTGTVKRAGSYRLYCDYYDHYLVVEPDAHPGWEVKLLHFTGLQVAAGDRVTARETVIGTGPRKLPFESQVDEYSHPRDWPHVHLEVVDPSIPDRPGSGC